MTETRYFSLARHALAEALRVADIHSGDIVAVPEFICRDLLSSIHHVGATVTFYPLDELFNPILLPPDSNVRAILAVNYFGFAQPLEPFYEYCRVNNAVLIEDNAHGFISSSKDGRLLGTRGQLGITSIRKTIRSGDGATLSVNDENFVNRLNPQLPSRSRESLRPIIIRFLAKLDRKYRLSIFRVLRLFIRRVRKFRTGHLLPLVDFTSETKPLFISAPYKSSMKMIEGVSRETEKNRRARAYKQVEFALSGLPLRPVFKVLNPETVPYGYPFFSDDDTARQASKITERFGYEIIKWPDLPKAVIDNAPIHYKNVWLVNFL